MKALYKRIVTLGMISATLILGWVYCMAEYRNSPAYIIVVSLALVISVYALLLALMDLHSAKEEDVRKYIDNAVASLISKEDDITVKLSKASYIQVRNISEVITRMEDSNAVSSERLERIIKRTTSSSKQNTTESINKALKFLLKYNDANTNKLVASVDTLTSDLEKLTTLVDKCSEDERAAFAEAISALSDDVMQVQNRIASMSSKISGLSVDTASDASKDSLDIFEEDVDADELPDFEDLMEAADETEENLEFATDDEITDADEVSVEEAIEAAAKADVIPFPSDEDDNVADKTEEPAPAGGDSNKQLSPDEIAALFAQAAPASEPEPADEPDISLDDIIDDKIEEPSPTAPVSDDSNKQLSPEEIAALFASIQ
ncbi:MAG: hypothetical protein NC393_03720 [Clostridium sp.]|nr:hypothetical protein [Clostridium sp.]MCM1171215.1 hypothetical protein [Clostridium sp.]MCM1208882.1 hypothetical protein [Ruminococcus sp.]